MDRRGRVMDRSDGPIMYTADNSMSNLSDDHGISDTDIRAWCETRVELRRVVGRRVLDHPLPREMKVVVAFLHDKQPCTVSGCSQPIRRNMRLDNIDDPEMRRSCDIGAYWNRDRKAAPISFDCVFRTSRKEMAVENLEMVVGLVDRGEKTDETVAVLPIGWSRIQMPRGTKPRSIIDISIVPLKSLGDHAPFRIANPDFPKAHQDHASAPFILPSQPGDIESFECPIESEDRTENIEETVLKYYQFQKLNVQLEIEWLQKDTNIEISIENSPPMDGLSYNHQRDYLDEEKKETDQSSIAYSIEDKDDDNLDDTFDMSRESSFSNRSTFDESFSRYPDSPSLSRPIGIIRGQASSFGSSDQVRSSASTRSGLSQQVSPSSIKGRPPRILTTSPGRTVMGMAGLGRIRLSGGRKDKDKPPTTPTRTRLSRFFQRTVKRKSDAQSTGSDSMDQGTVMDGSTSEIEAQVLDASIADSQMREVDAETLESVASIIDQTIDENKSLTLDLSNEETSVTRLSISDKGGSVNEAGEESVEDYSTVTGRDEESAYQSTRSRSVFSEAYSEGSGTSKTSNAARRMRSRGSSRRGTVSRVDEEDEDASHDDIKVDRTVSEKQPEHKHDDDSTIATNPGHMLMRPDSLTRPDSKPPMTTFTCAPGVGPKGLDPHFEEEDEEEEEETVTIDSIDMSRQSSRRGVDGRSIATLSTANHRRRDDRSIISVIPSPTDVILGEFYFGCGPKCVADLDDAIFGAPAGTNIDDQTEVSSFAPRSRTSFRG